MTKTAVVLFNLGGPDSLRAVKPFLFNLFFDPAIIRLPLPLRFLLAKLISSRRDKTAQHIYAQMQGRSPILPNTQAQANALETALNAQGNGEYKTFIAMRYWHPFVSEAAQAVKDFAPDRIILLPLYPQYSTTTTASSFKAWDRAASALQLNAATSRICCYPQEKGFIGAQAELLKQALINLKNVRILFSAHGLPKKIVDGGDPYQWQVEQTVAAIVETLGQKTDYRVCYQSRVGRLEWIGPATDAEIKAAAVEGKHIVVVPLAFVSEHSETLVELDIEYAQLAHDLGAAGYTRVPTVSVHPAFIEGLANLCIAHADKNGLSCADGKRICPAACSACPCSR